MDLNGAVVNIFADSAPGPLVKSIEISRLQLFLLCVLFGVVCFGMFDPKVSSNIFFRVLTFAAEFLVWALPLILCPILHEHLLRSSGMPVCLTDFTKKHQGTRWPNAWQGFAPLHGPDLRPLGRASLPQLGWVSDLCFQAFPMLTLFGWLSEMCL